MDTRNFQKRSPRSSAKSRQDSTGAPGIPPTEAEEKEHLDFSTGMVAHVRAAKEAAQREMESFGDVSEYDVVILQGQLKEEPVIPTQPPLDFEYQNREAD